MATREKADATLKNRCIEIHDSKLKAISMRGREAILQFSEVYIHESTGRPRIDGGTGWVQEALLSMSDATVKRSFSKFPADLLDGHIMLGESILENEIPIPLDHKGMVELRLESSNDEVVSIIGVNARLELVGEPKYIEQFRP